MTWLGSGWISTVLGVVNRFSITISYYIINLFNMELYPTSLRQSGMSLGDVISGGASAISPYVLHMVRFDTYYWFHFFHIFPKNKNLHKVKLLSCKYYDVV